MTDPFEALRHDPDAVAPRPAFARDLRARLVAALDLDPTDALPTIRLPERKPVMNEPTSTPAPDPDSEVVGAAPDETIAAASRPGTGGGIWAGVFYEDALAGIRFLVDVFGFEEQLVVVGPDDRTVVHSQMRWPEGGVVQAGTADPDNVFTHPPGEQSLYVVTADPEAVWQRCQAAGLEVIRPPEAPDHDPEGMGFSVRDPEGNIWSFGTYGLGAG